MEVPVSICIIAKNAAKLLPDCLSSLEKLGSEINIVVDKSTADNTSDVAKKFGARVFHRKFDNFANQKNFAARQASHDWVLFIDADETLSSELITEIKTLDFLHSAYRMPRLNYIFGKPIYHTNWGPKDDTHIWLYNRKLALWKGDVHEEVISSQSVGKLNSPKLHYPYTDVSDFMSKMNLYTSLETSMTNPVADFIRRYFWHLGFLDGWHGLYLSYLMFIYHTVSGIKLWQKNHTSG